MCTRDRWSACGLDGETGEVFERRLTPDHQEVLEWVRSLPGPVAVIYEAGPTGFGLARFLVAAGIECVVAAPSKLQRPSGDRVKTDARDARHLARLLHLGEIVAVAVPSVEQEAARDLVRAREDVPRGFDDGAAPVVETACCAKGSSITAGRPGQASTSCGCARSGSTPRALQLAYDTAFDAMLATVDRRDRLDDAITAMAADSAFTPVVTRLGCLRGVSTLTAFALAVEIGDWHRLTGRSIGAYLGLVPSEYSSGATRCPGRGHQDRQWPRRRLLIEAAWHHRAPYRPGAPSAARAGTRLTGSPGPRAGREPASARPLGPLSMSARNARWSPTPRSPVNWPAGAGRWPSSTTNTPQQSG